MPDQATIEKIREHALTVSKLKALLAELPDDALVVLSRDGEGNGFSPLADTSTGKYEPEQPWFGEFHEAPTHPARDEQPAEDALDAVCLWPTN
jgi:hypothetical protein